MRTLACLFVAALTGFISLSYEIIWYRVYAYSTVFAPQTFGVLLGVFLLGLAFGSWWFAKRARVAPFWFVAGALAAYGVVPFVAFCQVYFANDAFPGSIFSLPLVILATLMFGVNFPLMSSLYVRIDENAGAQLSLLYVANIVGSALGSLLTGYVLLDIWPLQSIAWMLLTLSALLVCMIFEMTLRSTRALLGALIGAILVLATMWQVNSLLFDSLFERLILKSPLIHSTHIVDLIENRHGVIAVTDDKTILGSGVYDGRISTSLLEDNNAIERAYALPAIHANPERVLMIGLSGGAWAQVVASMPEVKELVIVEINPGYLQIVSRYDEVKSILNNPKVKIVIDDGRRWMMRHPDEQFDVIMQNTTWHFIANATHLLSREYLALSKAHLKTGGFLYFNTTASVDVMKTATDVFAHVLRVQNLIAASDEPVRFDKARWRESIKRGLDEDTPRFAALMRFADSAGEPPTAWTLEEEAHLLPRISHGATVTDDNMLIEWKWWSDRWLFGY